MIAWLLDRLGITDLFERHKFARRFSLGWAIWIDTILILFYMEMKRQGVKFDDNDVTLILTFFGVLTTMIMFYKWSRDREDRLEAEKRLRDEYDDRKGIQ